jgi:two-component system cell cycle sensor histidine kinase/response regulator CckA
VTVTSQSSPPGLAQRLVEAEATIQALLSGEIDAVVDSRSQKPVLLFKAQEALRASEERYRRIVETTNDGIGILDIDGKITFVNRRLAEMFGYSPGEMLGSPLARFIADPIEAQEEMGVAPTREGEREVVFLRADGAELWALLKTCPTRETDGTCIGTLIVLTDRSRHRHAQEALRDSEERYRRIVETTHQGVWMLDPAGRTTFMNAHMAAMLGYDPVEVVGMAALDFVDPQSRDVALQDLGRSRQRPVQVEGKLRRKDGTTVWALLEVAPTFGKSGTVQGSLATVMDVTGRKNSEDALRVSQGHLLERTRIAALTAEVGLALAQSDPLPTILQRCAGAMSTHLDATLARIWTLNARTNLLELQGCAGMASPLDGPQADTLADSIGAHLVAQDWLAHFSNDLPGDGGVCDPEWARSHGIVAYSGHPLAVAGQLVGVVSMFAREPLSAVVRTGLGSLADAIAVGIKRRVAEDASASLEAQLRQSQKMEAVGRLAGGIAHDFNNILSVILSHSEMIISDLRPADPLLDDVKEIHQAGERAADLTRQLLLFSRQQVVESKVLDLSDILSGIEKMLQRLVGEDVVVTTVTRPGIGSVRVDPSSIEQVIMNLAVNARDAMPGGGRLKMETLSVVLDDESVRTTLGAKPGAYVVLSISDTGTGMDRATQARIFEPFFTTKEVGKGTGLGLSTVFGIVQQSGGHVWVESEVGVGTTFKIYLPRVDALPERARANPRPTSGGSETILLVEDEEQVRKAARVMLQRQGYIVLEARSAGEALLLSTRHAGSIHLLLSDVVMPGMSGPDLAKQLAERRPAIKVLCMSGYTDDMSVRLGVSDGAFAYLHKPLTVDALTRKVREVLDSDAPGDA